MLCALLKNNIVIETRDVSDEELANTAFINQWSQVIDITNDNPTPGVGWIFSDNKIQPPDGIVAKKIMLLTKLAYRQRLTTSELVSIYVAKATNPVLSMLIDNVAVSSYIDLERQDTINGTMYLVSLGLLTLTRAQEILTTPPSALELYRG